MARGKQLKLEDLMGPQHDYEALGRRLGVDLQEHRNNVATVVERLRTDDLDEATRRERPRAIAAAFGMLLVGAYGLTITLFMGLEQLLGLAAFDIVRYVSDDLDAALARVVQLGAFIAIGALIALLLWLREAYDQAGALALARPALSKSEATWGFFIPFVNLVRPYTALKQLHEASDPNQLPNIPEVEMIDGVANYRHPGTRRRLVPAAARDIRFPIGLFWASYLGGGRVLLPYGYASAQAIGLGTFATAATGLFGMIVIAAIHQRRVELIRRMRRILDELEQLEDI